MKLHFSSSHKYKFAFYNPNSLVSSKKSSTFVAELVESITKIRH